MQNEEKHIKELLRKYYYKNCSQAEIREVYHWIDQPGNKDLFFEFVDQLIEEEASKENTSSTESWQKLIKKIKDKSIERKWATGRNIWNWKVAATVSLLFFVSFSILLFSNRGFSVFLDTQAEPEHEMTIRHAEAGQKRTVSLPDGSKAILNSESTLRIPANYQKDYSRTVYLQGEAFFEVRENSKLPFLVKTADITTMVLGTSFNVEAYHTEKLKVAVLTGKVRVSHNSDSIDLIPDQLAYFDQQGKKLRKTAFDRTTEIGWKDGILVFNENSMQEMFNKLEKWYGVKVEIEGTVPQDSISAKYHDESLSTVLEGLSFLGNFKYTIMQNNVLIKFKKIGV